MTTVHVENVVNDFDIWFGNFSKYEQFRDQGVVTYRVCRGVTDPNAVIVDLDFADEAAAAAFLPKLAKIMASPQAHASVTEHRPPQLFDVVRAFAPVG